MIDYLFVGGIVALIHGLILYYFLKKNDQGGYFSLDLVEE